MDVKLNTNQGNFKMRVAGALIVDGKLLTVQICNNGFFCLPGGHVHLGENSKDAMLREFKEEVEIKCEVGELLTIVENFFKNKEEKVVHEVCYFYLIKPLQKIEIKDYSRVENDEGMLKNLEFKWVEIDDLTTVDFRPRKLAEKLKLKNYNFEHIIIDEKK